MKKYRGFIAGIILASAIICSFSVSRTLAQGTDPEFTCVTNGVEFRVYPGADQAARNSGVAVDLDTGMLYTPTGKVKQHDLTINNVSRVGLIRNDYGQLVIMAVWPNKSFVMMKCANGTIVAIDRAPAPCR